MGIFRVRLTVFSLQDESRIRELDVVVDSGATYPVIPRSLAEDLGIKPVEERIFTLADGSQISRSMAWAGLAFDGRKSAGVVVLGEEGDLPLLGAYGLEGLGLRIDPVGKALRPTTQYLLARA
jgi:clan AA aspartic protease